MPSGTGPLLAPSGGRLPPSQAGRLHQPRGGRRWACASRQPGKRTRVRTRCSNIRV